MAVTLFNKRSHRLINSVYPPVGIFDDFGSIDDARAAIELESMTNDRLSGAQGRLNAIAERDWAVGAGGAHFAMAAFLHPSPGGGRFNSGALGAWYAALSIDTAIRETLHHHTRRLRASAAGFPNTIQMRELISKPKARLQDLTAEQDIHPDLYHDSDYTASQTFGETLRTGGADGILYNSLRHQGGTNLVIYRPKLLLPVVQGDHYEYTWDAGGTAGVRKMTNVVL